jgi:hypothetical protein
MYLLIKKHAGSISHHHFETERELKEHLEAMWKFTDAELIAIVQDELRQANDKALPLRGEKGTP